MDSSFKPMWVSPPGETINEILFNKGVSYQQFAESIKLSEQRVNNLIEGKSAITETIAEQLANVLGSTKTFWLNRQSQYLEDLERFSEERNERKEWLKLIPSKDMLKYGWIEGNQNKEIECLKFFGVSTVSEWYQKYNNILSVTSFRTSKSFDSTPESVVTWLRRGEIISKSNISKPWSQSLFVDALYKARDLTREKDPQVFIPKLKQIFSNCGVAVAVEKPPNRCRASGAAYFLSPETALILLSGRYLTDDHFWFSFFHEAAHILLHGNMKLFLEFDDANKNTDKEETEADKFAESILIPEIFRNEFQSLNSKEWKKIVRFSKKINTSTGIVLGQLQHTKLVDHRYLNELKTRYKWLNGNLVKA